MVKQISKSFITYNKPAQLKLFLADDSSRNVFLGGLDETPENNILIPVSLSDLDYVDSEFTDVTKPDKYAICLRCIPGIIKDSYSSPSLINSDGLISLEDVAYVGSYDSSNKVVPYKYHAKRDTKYYDSALGFISSINYIDPTNGPVLPAGKTLDNFSIGLLPVQGEFRSAPPSSGTIAQMAQTPSSQQHDGHYVNLSQLMLNISPVDLYNYTLFDALGDVDITVQIDTSLFNIVQSTNQKAMLPRVGGQMISLLTADPTKRIEEDLPNSNKNYIIPIVMWDIGVVDLNPEV